MKNNKPPLVSNSPKTSSPVSVTISAASSSVSSFSPFLANISETDNGPSNRIESNRIVAFLMLSPEPASFNAKAIGAATSSSVMVAIILPAEEASFSLRTSKMIIPIGIIIIKTQKISSASPS